MSEEEIHGLMAKAQRSVESARRLLDAGDHDFAMSRAYYGMFYAATAALRCRGVTRSKHSGVIAAFGEILVKGGDIDPAHHGALREAFDDRAEAEYGDVFPAREAVEERLSAAGRFIETIRNFIDRQTAQENTERPDEDPQP